MEKLKKNWPTVLLLLAIAGCIFILNIATLLSPDDYSYANVIARRRFKNNIVFGNYTSSKIFIL